MLFTELTQMNSGYGAIPSSITHSTSTNLPSKSLFGTNQQQSFGLVKLPSTLPVVKSESRRQRHVSYIAVLLKNVYLYSKIVCLFFSILLFALMGVLLP
jgi:hypothetical protein